MASGLRGKLSSGQVCFQLFPFFLFFFSFFFSFFLLKEVLGVWISSGHPYSAEVLARSGADYVVIDMQHGIIEMSDVVHLIAVIELSKCVPIVRILSLEAGIISKVLDAGAHGIICPMINTRAEAKALVNACRYAPHGQRSWGPSICALRSSNVRAWAEENICVIPMVETTEALSNLDEIVSTPGIDAVYVGPADLSLVGVLLKDSLKNHENVFLEVTWSQSVSVQ